MFGFLKKKDKEYDPTALPGIGIPTSPHPLRGWTNLGMFEVHGVNSKTGRENKRTFEALTASDAMRKAIVEGLIEPITVTEIQRPMATDRQISYGASLGISITSDMSMVDASAMICRVNDGETNFRDFISKSDWVDACRKGVVISALCGHKFYRSAMKNAEK